MRPRGRTIKTYSRYSFYLLPAERYSYESFVAGFFLLRWLACCGRCGGGRRRRGGGDSTSARSTRRAALNDDDDDEKTHDAG